MGRTIPSTTARIDRKLQQWQPFGRVLPPDSRCSYESLITAARNARGPIGETDEPDIAIAIILAMLTQVKTELNNLHKKTYGKQHETQSLIPTP